jgi:hypothetical protein
VRAQDFAAPRVPSERRVVAEDRREVRGRLDGDGQPDGAGRGEAHEGRHVHARQSLGERPGLHVETETG